MSARADVPTRRGLLGLLTAVGVSQLGTRMSFLAIPWFVLTTTGSATTTGLVAFAEMAPYVAVQAVGGPMIDRIGAWRASVVGDLGAAVAVVAVPILYALGALHLVFLAIAVAVAGALRGGGDTARDVLVPGVADAAVLPMERAAGFYDGVGRLASLLGLPLAGVLISVTSALSVLTIDAATFLVSGVLVAGLVPHAAEPDRLVRPASGAPSYRASLREGFRYLRGDRLLLGIAVMVLVTNTLDQAQSAVLTPVWAADVAHSAVALGLIGGAFSLGAVLGNVAVAWLGPHAPRRITFGLGFIVAGAPRLIALALASTVSPILPIAFIGGLGAGGINPILGAVEYERVPRALQARVLGALGATAWAGIPIGSLAAGVMVEQVGLRGTLLICGAAYLLTTLSPFVFPVWREMDRANSDAQPSERKASSPA